MALTPAERVARYRARHPERAKASKAKHRAKPEVAEANRAAFKEWAEKNKDRRNAARRERYATDPEYRERQKKQNSEGQKHRRETVNRYRLERRKADPAFRLQHAIGVQMRNAIKGKGRQTWQSIVGYSADELRAHLEAQFEPWMNWQNYGIEWHIDHRRPIASFALPDEAALCWSLENLRPLSGRENMAKKHKIDPAVIPPGLMPQGS